MEKLLIYLLMTLTFLTMALPRFGVSNYKKKTYKQRPGRHAKSYSKRIPRRKRSVGQG